MGEPDVRLLQERVDPEQFLEWQAFFRLEPFGEWGAWLRAARICATVANTRAPGAFSAADFMPGLDGETTEAEAEASEDAALAAFMGMGSDEDGTARDNQHPPAIAESRRTHAGTDSASSDRPGVQANRDAGPRISAYRNRATSRIPRAQGQSVQAKQSARQHFPRISAQRYRSRHHRPAGDVQKRPSS